MNISTPSHDMSSEERLLAKLIRLRDSLPAYRQTKEYYKNGFAAIDEWLVPMTGDASLLTKLLNETDVIPSHSLNGELVMHFYSRRDKWASAVAFVKTHSKLINDIRDQIARLVLGEKCPNRLTLLESLKSKVLSLNLDHKTKPMKLIDVKRTLYPFLVKLPMIETWDEIYQRHLDDIGKRAATKATAKTDKPIKAPWKTRKKVETFGAKLGWDPILVDENVNRDGPDSWSMKEQRRLMTHFVGSRYAFVIDYMFSGNWGYCIMINVNTRKAFFAVPLEFGRDPNNYKRRKVKYHADTTSAIQALNDLLEQTPIKFLLMDNEKAWTSHAFHSTLNSKGIVYKHVPKNGVGEELETNHKRRLNHSSTSLVDRLIRTIRMMNYNMGLDDEIPPSVLRWLINEYNSSPHSTLSKHLGRPVSPNEVDQNPELERKICSSISRENFIIRCRPEYALDNYVRVYNAETSFDKVKPKFLPGYWEVVEREDGLVKVRQGDANMKVSRWMLKS